MIQTHFNENLTFVPGKKERESDGILGFDSIIRFEGRKISLEALGHCLTHKVNNDHRLYDLPNKEGGYRPWRLVTEMVLASQCDIPYNWILQNHGLENNGEDFVGYPYQILKVISQGLNKRDLLHCLIDFAPNLFDSRFLRWLEEKETGQRSLF